MDSTAHYSASVEGSQVLTEVKGRETKLKFTQKRVNHPNLEAATHDFFSKWLSLLTLRDYFRARRRSTDMSGSEKANLGLGLGKGARTNMGR